MENKTSVSDKICLITGATSGIGTETALALAKMGATVVIAARNEAKAKATVAEIKRASGNDAVDYLLVDLASLESVRKFAADFQAKYARLHVLVNNAGLSPRNYSLTQDGFETTFGVNHLAPFLLTNLLLDTIRESAPARIINVSSDASRFAKINFDNLNMEKGYNFFTAYGQSKLANVLFTYELARRLEGTGVTVNALHPGVVVTNFGKNSGFPFSLIQGGLARAILLSPEEGAQTSIYLASSPLVEGVTGKYFDKKQAVPSSKNSYDQSVQKRLWEVSEKLIASKQEAALAK